MSQPAAEGAPAAGSFKAKLGALLFLAGIFFLNFLSRIILAPLMPAMEQDLGLSHGQAGSLFLMISAGYFITLAGSGFVSSRLNHRRTIILSTLALGLAMLLVSLGRTLGEIRAALVLVGLGAGLYLPSGIATLTTLVSQKNWGKAVAIHELAPNLGLVLAPVVSEAFLGWSSWRTILALLGLASMASGAAFVLLGRGGRFPGQAPGPAVVKVLVSRPSFWIMMSLFSLGIGASLGVYAMLPLYLVAERGFDRGWANTLIALSRISGLFMALLAGWAADRLGQRRGMETTLLTAGLATVLLGAGRESWLAAMVFLQPALAVCFFPAGFAALSRIVPPEMRNLAVSLAIPLAFLLGGGALPAGIGLMGEAGNFALGIALSGALILAGPVLVRFLKFMDEP